MSMLGGWDKPEVALAQFERVIEELQRPDRVGPFAAFRWAMGQIGIERGTLLDVGCGVGHYGVLCERYYPGIAYSGTDASHAMIDRAGELAPLGTLRACPFEDNDFGQYDIVLVGQVMELLDCPITALRLLLCQVRGYVILNRLRLNLTEPSHAIEETTYCGNMGRDWIWNQDELLAIISEYANVIARSDWDNQTTLVLRARNGECSIRGGCDCDARDCQTAN